MARNVEGESEGSTTSPIREIGLPLYAEESPRFPGKDVLQDFPTASDQNNTRSNASSHHHSTSVIDEPGIANTTQDDMVFGLQRHEPHFHADEQMAAAQQRAIDREPRNDGGFDAQMLGARDGGEDGDEVRGTGQVRGQQEAPRQNSARQSGWDLGKIRGFVLKPFRMILSPLWPVWKIVRAMPGALAMWLFLSFAESSSHVSINSFYARVFFLCML